MIKRTLGVAIGALALVILFAGSASAQYQPTGSQVLSANVVAPGATITVSGTGCPAGSNVTTALDGTTLGTSTADAGGNFTVSITIPSSTAPGTHTVTSTCGSVVLSSTLTVTGAGTSGGTTGTSTGGTSTGGTSTGGTSTGGTSTLARTGAHTTNIL